MQHLNKFFFIVVPLTLLTFAGKSQSNDNEKAISIIRELADLYKHAGNLSFDISFKYSTEQKPDHFLDSLTGKFKMNDSVYWYDLENTECVFDSRYLIMLFKEDKIMYLSKPNLLTQPVSPLALLDSMLNNKRDIQCEVYNVDGYTKIAIEFSGNSNYKKIEYYVDSKTGYLSTIKTWVKTAELYDPSVKSQVNQVSYVIVQTNYYNYRKNDFDKELFDMARYFRKDGAEFVSVAPFQDYKIFIGTPNL